MAGDGVSLPTTIAQMGNVAKTQARGQQSAAPVTPFNEQTDKEENLKVQRVKEMAEAAKGRINPDDDRADKRKRRRLKRNAKSLAQEEDPEPHEDEDGTGQEEEQLGCLIDLRV